MNCVNGIAVDCPCTADCVRHGKCCECVTNHAEKGSLPACLRFMKPALKERRREEKRQEKERRRNR